MAVEARNAQNLFQLDPYRSVVPERGKPRVVGDKSAFACQWRAGRLAFTLTRSVAGRAM